MLVYGDETVIRSGLPVPIGSRLGKIAESLLALAKRIFGTLAHERLGHYFPDDF